jgi:cytochrome c553
LAVLVLAAAVDLPPLVRTVIVQGGAAGAPPCAGCHGEDGAGAELPGIVAPRLAGQLDEYLVKQVDDFSTGQRAPSPMNEVAQQLLERERNEAAMVYSRLRTGYPSQRELSLDTYAQGEEPARLGLPRLAVPACFSCHGPGGRGVPPATPVQAGQLEPYLARQLADFRAGDRRNDPDGVMRSVAAQLDDTQLASLAAYLANLRP